MNRIASICQFIFYTAMFFLTLPRVLALPLLLCEFILFTLVDTVHTKFTSDIVFFAFVFRLLSAREYDECLLGTCDVESWSSYLLVAASFLKWVSVLEKPAEGTPKKTQKITKKVEKLPEKEPLIVIDPDKITKPIRRVPDSKLKLRFHSVITV